MVRTLNDRKNIIYNLRVVKEKKGPKQTIYMISCSSGFSKTNAILRYYNKHALIVYLLNYYCFITLKWLIMVSFIYFIAIKMHYLTSLFKH